MIPRSQLQYLGKRHLKLLVLTMSNHLWNFQILDLWQFVLMLWMLSFPQACSVPADCVENYEHQDIEQSEPVWPSGKVLGW